MFDLGWDEMALIAVVALLVLGPKELPTALRTASTWMRAARKLAGEFQSGVNDIIREADLDDARKQLNDLKNIDKNVIQKKIEEAVDPTGEIKTAFNRDEDPAKPDALPAAAPDPAAIETAPPAASPPAASPPADSPPADSLTPASLTPASLTSGDGPTLPPATETGGEDLAVEAAAAADPVADPGLIPAAEPVVVSIAEKS